MKTDRILLVGFVATILTMTICTFFICKGLRAVAYAASGAPDAVVRQLEEEGQKNRDLARGIKRDEPIAWPPLSQ